MKVDSLLLIALHESEGVGWKTINRIISNGEPHEGLLSYDANDWRACGLSVEKRTNWLGLSFRCRKKAD